METTDVVLRRNGAAGQHDLLGEAIETIADLYTTSSAAVERLREQLAEETADKSRLERGLRALAPEHPALPEPKASKPKAKAKSARKDYPDRMLPDALDAVWAWVREQDPSKRFTQVDAGAAVTVNRSAVAKALGILRSAEAVRLVGQEPIPGGTTSAFRLLDLYNGDEAAAVNRREYRGPGKRKAAA